MNYKNRVALTYDDIQLVPKYSEVETRLNVDLSTRLSRNYRLKIPLIASPMDTVCGSEMAYKMHKYGGVGCIHRFSEPDDQLLDVRALLYRIWDSMEELKDMHTITLKIIASYLCDHKIPIMAAIGVGDTGKYRAEKLVSDGVNVLLIDVAHGHHKKVIDMVDWCKKTLPDYVDIIGGSITTSEAAIDLQDAGVDGLRVGVGNGSLCQTRENTGFGIPTVTALQDVVSVSNVPVIADGGIRKSGDIAKALALGASSVMLGSLLAGTEEAPGKIIETDGGLYKRYRGSASLETKVTHNQDSRNIEGAATNVPYKGGIKYVLSSLLDGVRSALSYGGANNIEEFYPEYVQVTNAGIIEARPHLLY